MNAFDVLGDPVRRRILELLADGERAAGDLATAVGDEYGISQPAVSQHLRVLRDSGFTTVRAEGTRRLYSVDPTPLTEAEQWLSGVRQFWEQHLDALGTELARGKRERRRRGGDSSTDATTASDPAASSARTSTKTSNSKKGSTST